MGSQSFSENSLRDLTRTIALLNDVQDALRKNSLLEEAQLVSHHVQQLLTPQVETRIEERGIDPVLEEMAREFSAENSAHT